MTDREDRQRQSGKRSAEKPSRGKTVRGESEGKTEERERERSLITTETALDSGGSS